MTNCRQFFVLFGLFLFCFQGICDEAVARESRIWADKSGKHELRAIFIDIKDGKARLERPNGSITRIPVDKLCEEDQEYIRTLKDEKPEEKAATPSKPSSPVGLAVGDKIEAKRFSKWKLGVVTEIDYKWEHVSVRYVGGRETDSHLGMDDLRIPGTMQHPFLVKPVDPALSEMKSVRPDMSEVDHPVSGSLSETTVSPDPAPARDLDWKPKPIRLRGSSNFHERITNFSISAQSNPLAIILYTAPGFSEEDTARIEIIDLRAKRMLTGGPAPPGTKRAYFSPSGTRLLTLIETDPHEDTIGTLDLWDIDGKKVNHVIRFSPYVMNSWPDADPEWLEWIDDERYFTVNGDGLLILWEAKNAKAIYELEIDSWGKPTLSPGRKQLVVPTSDGLEVYEAQSGELLATVGTGSMRNATLAFSPSGQQLAVVSNGFVDVIDVTTGKPTRSFPCEGVSRSSGVWWIDEEYLIDEKGTLINVPRRLIAWKFENGGNKFVSSSGTHWLLSKNYKKNSRALLPIQLPPPAAIEAVQSLTDDELLAVQPGASVTVDVQIRDRQLAGQVETSLTEALEEAGMKVNGNEPLTLVATMKTGESVSINYRSFGVFRGKGETIKVNRRIYELKLLFNGEEIWSRTSIQAPPHHLRLEKGESIRAAVARTMRPMAGSFRGRLPAYVLKPEYLKPLGTSRVIP